MTGTGTPSFRRAVVVLLALVTLLATAGCVNLPANTDVNVVGNPAKGGTGADVRIWPQAPRPGVKPEQIVEGFIQTAASDPSNLPIAQDYLTSAAQDKWDPNKVAVFSDLSSPTFVTDQTAAPGHVKVQITGTIVATVADNGAYEQVQDPVKDFPYVFNLTFDPSKGYYRIDRLPTSEFGILITQEAFRANYAAYYLYYLDESGPTPSMIPVPDYQRSQAGDAVTAQNLVKALLPAPPNALNGIAVVAAPNASFLGGLTISPDNTASVPIKIPGNCAAAGRRACDLFADELLATFSSLASVSKVELVDAQGNPLAFSSSVDTLASRYNIAVSAAKSTSFYYLDAKNNQVNRYESATAGTNSTNVDQVGPDNRKYSQVAVGFAAPQTFAAVVDDKGSKLYVSTPGSSKDTEPVFTALTGHHISSLTWDAFGHLWFLDTAGTNVALYRLDMAAQPSPLLQQVNIAGDGGTIDEIAVAPDGRRIAVSYADSRATQASPATYSVVIAMVTNTQAGLQANLSFGIEQPVVDHWTSVVDVSWHGSQALAVLGSASSSSPPTINELNSDGSPVINAADLSPVTYNPPTGTTEIEWTGAALLAATHSGNANAPVQQIEQYSFTTGTWTLDANGFSPTYAN